MNWKTVAHEGMPTCDGKTVFVGVNAAGHCGCFNALSKNVLNNVVCMYDTKDGSIEIMSGLEWWCELKTPNA